MSSTPKEEKREALQLSGIVVAFDKILCFGYLEFSVCMQWLLTCSVAGQKYVTDAIIHRADLEVTGIFQTIIDTRKSAS